MGIKGSLNEGKLFYAVSHSYLKLRLTFIRAGGKKAGNGEQSGKTINREKTSLEQGAKNP